VKRHRALAPGMLAVGGLLAIYWLVPVVALKAVALGAVLTLFIYAIGRGVTITPRGQVALLGTIYGFAFLAVPYWASGDGVARQALAAVALLAGGAVLVATFRRLSGCLAWSASPRSHLLFAALFAAALAIQYSCLTASLTYYGDSDYHTTSTLSVIDAFARPSALLLAALALVWLEAFRRTGQRWLLAVAGLTFAALGVYMFSTGAPRTWYLRYPAAFYYLNAVVSVPVEAFRNRQFAYQEGFYRLLSLAVVVGIATLTALRLAVRKPWGEAALAGVAVLTLPILSFYASLTYIEIPVVLLMLVVLLRLEIDVAAFVEQGVAGPAILALVALGFLKEHVIVFQAVVLGVVLLELLRARGLTWRTRMVRGAGLGVLALLPLAMFLAFRQGGPPFTPNLQYVVTPANYAILGRALWEQFGLLAPLSVVAWMVAWRNGHRLLCTVALILFAGYTLFFSCVNWPVVSHLRVPGPRFLGHSRYNLYLLPGFLALCTAAAGSVRRGLVALAAVVVLAVNVLLAPVGPFGADRGVFWGDYTERAADLAVPYDEFYRWLAGRGTSPRVLVIGRAYEYQDRFYFMKYRIRPRAFVVAPRHASVPEWLRRAGDFDFVVSHEEPFAGSATRVPDGAPLARVSEFATGAVRLVVYRPQGAL